MTSCRTDELSIRWRYCHLMPYRKLRQLVPYPKAHSHPTPPQSKRLLDRSDSLCVFRAARPQGLAALCRVQLQTLLGVSLEGSHLRDCCFDPCKKRLPDSRCKRRAPQRSVAQADPDQSQDGPPQIAGVEVGAMSLGVSRSQRPPGGQQLLGDSFRLADSLVLSSRVGRRHAVTCGLPHDVIVAGERSTTPESQRLRWLARTLCPLLPATSGKLHLDAFQEQRQVQG